MVGTEGIRPTMPDLSHPAKGSSFSVVNVSQFDRIAA
jgi:hypothetical protein